LRVIAGRLESLAQLKARDLFDAPTLRLIERNNAEIFDTKGRSIGARWGNYKRKREHPLPKGKGDRYWLVDKDYFSKSHLRSSLANFKSRDADLTFRNQGNQYRLKRIVAWSSKVEYAQSVNRQYGKIFGLSPSFKRRILAQVRARIIAHLTGTE
jgi:hypothetical protein